MNSEPAYPLPSARQFADLTCKLAAQAEHFAAVAPRIVESIDRLARRAEAYGPEIAEFIQHEVTTIRQVLGEYPVAVGQHQPLTTHRTGGVELAQEITGKARSTVYNLVSAGKLPVRKVLNKLYFDERELRAFMDQPRPGTFVQGVQTVIDQLAPVVDRVEANSGFTKALKTMADAAGASLMIDEETARPTLDSPEPLTDTIRR